MAADPKPVAIADLRWLVTLARRDQVADDEAGIIESLVDAVRVHAKIEDLYPTTYFGAQQTDRPVTHMIWLRWLDWLDTTHVIVRDTRRADGSLRRQVFRIRRVKEVAGRNRFLEMECELEQRADA